MAGVYGKIGDFGRSDRTTTRVFRPQVRTLVNVYEVLVATKRALNPAVRAELLARARRAGAPAEQEALITDPTVLTYYTFEYTYFSERQLWQAENGGAMSTTDNSTGPGGGSKRGPPFSEPPTHKAYVHADDAVDRYENVDLWAGMSSAQFAGLVGAWRVGKVLDVAARRREDYWRLGFQIDL